MKGDFSRRVFDAGKHYAGVLHQQGRVWLDSDWNEEVSEQLDLLRQETADIVGVCGVPEPGAAFLISANPNVSASAPGDFLIGGGPGNLGRAYIDGVMCQIDGPATYLTQPDLPAPPPIPMPADGSDLNGVVYLEVWGRLITTLEDTGLREVALGGPDTTTRIKTIAQVRVAVVPQSSPVVKITNANAAQFLPVPGGGTLTTLQSQVLPSPDQCQLPDPNSFTGSQNRLYRVEIHDGGDPLGGSTNSVLVALASDAAAGATTLQLAQALTAPQIDAVTRWGTLTIADNNGRSERAVITGITNNGQTVVLSQGLTNAFAAAANAVVLGVARFKWSRDNGSFAVSVVSVSSDRQTLTLASLGRDQATALRQGDLVEICDDASELGAVRGHLTNLQSDPDPDQLTVVLAQPLPSMFQRPSGSPGVAPTSPPSVAVDRHLVLRRWDGQGTAQATFSETATPDMDLGDGVQIQFGGTNLLPGDFWQFTARSADGSIELLQDAPSVGIVRHRCPLAVVSWSLRPLGSPPQSPPAQGYALSRIEDCRNVFPPLIDVPRTEAGLHVQRVFVVNQQSGRSADLVNDSAVLVSTIITGINVQCDGNVDPASISRPTCFLSVEVPWLVAAGTDSPPPSQQPVGYNIVNVAGNVSAAGNTITWLPGGAAADWLPGIALNSPAADRGILARLTLKGNFIWTPTNPPSFLDGEVFGFEQNGVSVLSLPSGDRRRGGNFEIWFWLIAQPATLASFGVSQLSIFEGDTTTGTITLSNPATSGLVVTLGNSAPAIATVPANVSFATGTAAASFPIVGTAQGSTTISATLGAVTQNATLAVALRPTTLSALLISPALVTAGTSTTGSITLSQPAPQSTLIALASNNPGVASVPASVSAVPGSLTVAFTIGTSAAGTATITATFGNSVQASVTAVKTKEKDKDKDFIKEKDKDKENFKELEKISAAEKLVFQEQIALTPQQIPLTVAGTAGALIGGANAATGRAFIRSDERPAIPLPA
jgi:hypothetical protein